MENSFGLQTQQRQEMTLTPQQRLSLEVLAAPLMELQTRLSQEVQANPMLELGGSGLETGVGDPISNMLAAEDRAALQDVDPEERDYEQLATEDRWLDDLPIQETDSGEAADRSRRHDFALNSITAGSSAQDELLEQLRFVEAKPEVLQAAEAVIGNLDERGFLTATDKELAVAANTTETVVKTAVKLVQSFEPAGIAAHDLPECMLLQLQRRNIDDPILIRLIKFHLDDLAHNQLPLLSRHFQLPVAELKKHIAVLKTLNMRPGALLENAPEPIIVPEFTVKIIGDKLVIADTPGVLPQLSISTDYDGIMNDLTTPAEAKKYLQERKTAAEQLIWSLSQRESTLKRITELLASAQYDFFFNGPGHLRPLTMAQLAAKLDLHETTVSRAVGGKYLGTPFGVFEYRYFFSGGYTSTDGEAVAAEGIKEKIRRIVADEDRKKPLSDDKIAKILQEDGLNVARRTVAKYREELNILPSHLRKDF